MSKVEAERDHMISPNAESTHCPQYSLSPTSAGVGLWVKHISLTHISQASLHLGVPCDQSLRMLAEMQRKGSGLYP
jgi:hypothetical protein